MRIGVNISNDLRERMKPLMLVSNISQICRDAIKSYVENYERAQERVNSEGMEQVAERIAKEITPEYIDWGTLGLEDAKLWVQLAKATDFKRLLWKLEIRKSQSISPWEQIIPPVMGAKSFYERENEHKDWRDWVDDRDDGTFSLYLAAKSEYEQAYLNYILAVWEMVQDRIACNNTIMDENFREARKKSYEEGLKDGKIKAEIIAQQENS